MSKSKAPAAPVDCSTSLTKVGNHLQMGVVGMPNVGKSSLFNLLSKSSIAEAQNYPFCTIDPNLARCLLPDERFNWLCDFWKPKSEIPAYLQITDIAGLVKGASEGAGLGNAFLSHIQAVDGIYHMIRAFENSEIIHVEDCVDPVRDLDIISKELIAKDLEFANKSLKTLQNSLKNKTIDKAKQVELDAHNKVIALLTAGKHARYGQYLNAELEHIKELRLLTAKPAVYLINLSEEDFIRKKNKWLAKIKAWVDENGGGTMIPVSVAFEEKLFQMASDEERKEYEKTAGATSIIPKIIKTGYSCLQLLNFFTCGTDEVRAWTFQKGFKAPQCAGVIHTDFEKGFIMAETMAYNDFFEYKSESECKAKGKYRMEGRNYEVQDGDIIFFKFGQITAAKKK